MENIPIPELENYERPEILKLLLNRVNGLKNKYRQNIAIVGPQSLGKTSLIFNLLHHCNDNKIIPIYIYLKPKSLEVFAKNFIGILLYQFLISEHIEMEDNLDFLLNASRPKIPKTVRAVIQINKLIRESAPKDEIFSLVLELPQFLYDETKKPLLLIFDEFQNLDNFELSKPYFELSNKIMVQKNTMYIMVSSATHQARNILNKKLSLLFGNFEIINILPFNARTSGEFIEKRLGTVKISAELKNFLIYLTGGYPFYLYILTEQIKSLCHDGNSDPVNEDIVIMALGETLYKNHGILNQHFNNKYHCLLNTNHNNLYPSILLALASGIKKPKQIGKHINRKTAEINRHINKLIQWDVITKKGVFNCINDPLLAHWLKLVLYPQQFSFNMDANNASNEFENSIKGLMLKFSLESQKKLSVRLKELFEKFENEIVELDKKRFMLTHFDEIVIKESNGLSTVNARRLKKIWFCAIEEGFIDEAKIGTFLENARRKDCIKKILIALDGIDPTARLKALEAKVWIWDQNTVNDLFSLFEKPRIIK
ncbi:MAG: ATP-binding protein [Candidatus Omnitrophica bacterium]|nr:ATP-binding protein [Candidatus Omnitrophota bacterium]